MTLKQSGEARLHSRMGPFNLAAGVNWRSNWRKTSPHDSYIAFPWLLEVAGLIHRLQVASNEGSQAAARYIFCGAKQSDAYSSSLTEDRSIDELFAAKSMKKYKALKDQHNPRRNGVKNCYCCNTSNVECERFKRKRSKIEEYTYIKKGEVDKALVPFA